MRQRQPALDIPAMTAARSRTTFLGAPFRRLWGRHGYSKALVATDHSIVTAIWHILSNGEFYRDFGSDFYAKRTLERTIRRKTKGPLWRWLATAPTWR